jgi:hypothetical protein
MYDAHILIQLLTEGTLMASIFDCITLEHDSIYLGIRFSALGTESDNQKVLMI